MAENKKSGKYFFLKKGYDKKGKEVVEGVVKLFVKKHYGSDEIFTLRDVQINNGEATQVGNVVGSVLVDEYAAKVLKYYFSKPIPTNTFVNVKLAFWGTKADLFKKWSLKEGDLLMFLCTGLVCNEFKKRDGSQAYQIEGNVLEWDLLRKKKCESSAYEANHSNDMDAVAESDFYNEGFTEVDLGDDDGDLPF